MITWMKIKAAVVLVGIATALCDGATAETRSTSPPARVANTVGGDDWWLPSHVKITPYSGYYTWSPEWSAERGRLERFQDGNLHFACWLSLKWSDLNPAEGVYNWEPLDERIKQATAIPGTGFMFWIYNYTEFEHTDLQKVRKGADRKQFQPVIPGWVVAKSKVKILPDGSIAAWEAGCRYQEFFGKFLKALGQRYKDHPKLVAVDMRGLDADWGEFYFPGSDSGDRRAVLRQAEAETGLSPETFRTWGLRFVDDFLAAFQGQESKLVWMAGGDSFVSAPGIGREAAQAYGVASRAIRDLAYEKGCGGRDGGYEWGWWNQYRGSGHGMRLTEEGYLEFDEDFAPVKSGRMWGSENECYGWGGSQPASFKAEWFITCLRHLQMRRNWMNINHTLFSQLEATAPEFTRWVELSQGKTPQTSADAWCWLREGYPRGVKAFKNFERWLSQRDVKPDGLTVPAASEDVSEFHRRYPWLVDKDQEFFARRTDGAAGGTAIYFRADPHFISGGPRALQLKVTYLDGAATKWCMEYASAGGTSRTPAIETTGSGKWKTVTFEMLDMQFTGALPGKTDFRLALLGAADVTVKFVRLIKPNPPDGESGSGG